MDEVNQRFAARARVEKERFLRILENARSEQDTLFRRILDANRDTAFGREHGFSAIRSVADYRRAVPIRGYTDLEPWIERCAGGERRVLTDADPILFFSTTGTTGRPKIVPVTREFFRIWTNNLLVYWANLIEYFPRILERDDTIVMLHLAPKPYSEWTPSGVPIHSPTYMPAQFKGGFPHSRAPWFPPPSASDAERLYYLVRLSAESELYGLACLHPSRLQALAILLQQEGPRLVKELFEGTVCGSPGRAPARERARELAALLERGSLSPRDLWPSLRFVSCWTGGSFGMYLPELRSAYGGEIVPQMTASSEAGHMTMPIERDGRDGPLTPHANFYEFVPVVSGSPNDAPDAEALTFEELESGATYEMVVTTVTGLYRYVCGDVFRVIGFTHGVPRLEFVGRSGVGDMAGEKVSEEHVLASVRAALAECALEASNVTCCALWTKPPGYTFVFEPTRAWTEGEQRALAARLDDALQQQNSRYQLKRSFGDLAPAVVRVVARGSFARHRAKLVESGVPGTQLKDKVLHLDGAILEAFEALDAFSSS
jgi:hypothetical protein